MITKIEVQTSVAIKWIATCLVFLLSACQSPPTKVYEARDIEFKILADKLRKPLVITEDTVLIDAREPFDYAMTHAPGAVNVQWTDFTVRGPVPGLFKDDLYSEARRLARMGIGPDTPVVILGKASKGRGEEGRLAWTLLYLGIKDVQTAELDSLGLRYSNISSPERKNANSWKPVVAKSALTTREEILKIGTGKADTRSHLIDVRTEVEFMQKDATGENYLTPDLRAVNIPWTEFFSKNGRPNPAIVERLRAIDIQPNDRVVFVSHHGVRSGAAAYALTTLGYSNVANYAGGWVELMQDKKKRR
jgi:thiosulfate/3-mercaptopyruvate sulfurtransferase